MQAKKKIKRHLVNRGDRDDFEVTPSLVMYWWRELNEAIFDGKLNPPAQVIVKHHLKEAWAWCEGGGFSKRVPVNYAFQRKYDDKEMFLTILAHEMVHHWEQQTTGRMSHGKNFFKWEERLKQVGIPLDKSY